MQAESTIEEAVDLLVAVRKEQRSIGHLPDRLKPSSVEQGYVLQQALSAALGETPIGWKIACTNSQAQALMQTDEPFAGPLFESMVHTSPAVLPSGQFNMRMVEGEFAFRLGHDLPCRGEPYSLAEVQAAVAAVHPAIEVADSRFDDWLAVGLPSLVADGAVCGAFVYGESCLSGPILDLVNWPVTISANGQTVGQGTGENALGDPFLSLLWLANKRLSQGGGLKSGQIVTTGTCTGNFQAPPDTTVVADFGDMGSVSVRFTVD